MPLADRLSKLTNPAPRAGVVQHWLDTLSDEDRKLVLKYMATPNTEISHLSLLQALQDEGAEFGKEALSAFRKNLWKNNG